MTIWSEFYNNSHRTVHKWEHYLPAYERHFSSFVGRPLLLMEIGVGDGGSLQMWRRYFGPYARFLGVDNREQCLEFIDNDIDIRIGDQADPNFLDHLLIDVGVPDIIIDDGSHMMDDVCATFRHLYHRLPRNGVYVVEDMHTAYWPEYGGGFRSPASFIELSKALVDELNADLSRGAVDPTNFTNTTNAIAFYNSMVVFERGEPLKRRDVMTGTTGHFGPAESGTGILGRRVEAGRAPSVATERSTAGDADGEVDPAWYSHRYPDVAKSGMDPDLHYRMHGAAEGRSPNPGALRD